MGWPRGAAFASLVAALGALLGLSVVVDGGLPGLVVAAVGVVLALAVGVDVRVPSGSSARVRGASLRRQAALLAFLSLRDPDGPGRCRPRAPGAGPAVR
ncbi:DUF6412 domain-containing protein [Streptomyces sp. SID3343]|uniref:DUF6412 domain-containing protein n=1 Tax=Streptomyces sp. SID3343 TaxID=2690260 RepID=UPI001F46EEA6|nr:DUF6412 domain-containing protein [Streptomyces sp. SID3343]